MELCFQKTPVSELLTISQFTSENPLKPEKLLTGGGETAAEESDILTVT